MLKSTVPIVTRPLALSTDALPVAVNMAVPVGTVLGVQLFGSFQSVVPPFHVASCAWAAPPVRRCRRAAPPLFGAVTWVDETVRAPARNDRQGTQCSHRVFRR